MSRFSSATLSVGLLRLPPPQILQDPQRLQAWYAGLSPLDRGRFETYITELMKSQPTRVQQQIQKNLNRIQSTTVGMGWVAGLITGLTSAVTQAGVSIYTGNQQNALQERLAGKQMNTQAQIAAMQSAVQKSVEETYAEAQTEAAKTAGAAMVASSYQSAGASVARTQMIMKYLTPVLIGVVGLGGYYFLRRRRR